MKSIGYRTCFKNKKFRSRRLESSSSSEPRIVSAPIAPTQLHASPSCITFKRLNLGNEKYLSPTSLLLEEFYSVRAPLSFLQSRKPDDFIIVVQVARHTVMVPDGL
jgi:hypothetical protein